MSGNVAAGPDVFGVSDTGLRRQRNEDHFIVALLRKELTIRQSNVPEDTGLHAGSVAEAQIFAVADGVGGHEDGDVASRLTLTMLVEYLARAAACFNQLDTEEEHAFLERLEAGVHEVHLRLVAALGQGSRPPASTLTMATLVWPRAYLVHVGDSRAMYLHGGILRTLTRDQTYAELLVDDGTLTPEQAARSMMANTLTSAIGGLEMMPSVGLVDFVPGDVLLLCSDGLTKHVPDGKIAERLRQPWTAEQMATTLLQDALDGGGTDNVTVLVARMLG